MRRAILHFACAFLLLNAQLGALTHSVWHLHDFLPAHEQNDPGGAEHDERDKLPSSQAELCVFHAALSSLFTGGCAEKPVIETAGISGQLATLPAVWRVAQTVALPPSRAPPVLS